MSVESNITYQFKMIRIDQGQNVKILSSVDFTNTFFILYLYDHK